MPETETYQEIDGDILAQEAYAEMEGKEPAPRKKDDDETQPVKQKEVVEPQPEEGEEVKDPDKEVENDEPEEGSEEKPSEEKEGKEEEKSEDNIITEHAQKQGMTYAEAKVDLEANQSVVNNYKTPEEMARALRSTQSAYDKLKNQSQEQEKPVFQRQPDSVILKQAKVYFVEDDKGVKEVEAYRDEFPASTQHLEDDAVVEILAKQGVENYKKYADDQESEIKQTAQKRRDEIISSIEDEDRKFLPDVKSVLENTNPQYLLSKMFNVEDLLRHARGEKTRYQSSLKEAEERGYKRGAEQAEIVGAKTGTGGGQRPSGAGVVQGGLSNAQKKRASDMFSYEDGYSEDEANKAFQEVHKKELKENPNFVY